MTAATLLCVPGGGSLAADTFDATPLGRAGYSFRRAMTERGFRVELTELPGVVDSTPGDAVTMDTAAAVVAAAADAIDGWVIGVGHSLGGAVVVRAEASQRPFDALVVLGYSPSWSSLPHDQDRPLGADAELVAWTAGRLAEGDPATWADASVRFPEQPGFLHLADVPPEIVQWSSNRSVRVPRRLAQEFGVPELQLRDAAAVDVPVLLVFGDIDAAAEPAQEPKLYPNAEVTLERLHGSGHAHHLATSRTHLWDLVDRWLRTVLSIDAEEAP